MSYTQSDSAWFVWLTDGLSFRSSMKIQDVMPGMREPLQGELLTGIPVRATDGSSWLSCGNSGFVPLHSPSGQQLLRSSSEASVVDVLTSPTSPIFSHFSNCGSANSTFSARYFDLHGMRSRCEQLAASESGNMPGYSILDIVRPVVTVHDSVASAGSSPVSPLATSNHPITRMTWSDSNKTKKSPSRGSDLFRDTLMQQQQQVNGRSRSQAFGSGGDACVDWTFNLELVCEPTTSDADGILVRDRQSVDDKSPISPNLLHQQLQDKFVSPVLTPKRAPARRTPVLAPVNKGSGQAPSGARHRRSKSVGLHSEMLAALDRSILDAFSPAAPVNPSTPSLQSVLADMPAPDLAELGRRWVADAKPSVEHKLGKGSLAARAMQSDLKLDKSASFNIGILRESSPN